LANVIAMEKPRDQVYIHYSALETLGSLQALLFRATERFEHLEACIAKTALNQTFANVES
jgi:hypothetical protein